MMDTNRQLLLLTRAGYEGDCAAQVQAVAAEAGVHGFCKAKADTGYLTFIAHDAQALAEWFETLDLDDLIFARQLCLAGEPLADLPPDTGWGRSSPRSMGRRSAAFLWRHRMRMRPGR